ncbi:putative Vacuolar basic amino acid transporter 5 (putative) [Pseudozyma hubeiensis]|nr:putative Vacuolar basic amino acid transporter 5 (putative) [Pseudozyma hubeiensis]
MSSTPQPMEPLSNSPSIAYHPWSSHQEQELRGQSSRSQLIIPTHESVSFHTAYSHDHQQGDYWEQPALQPSRPIFTHMSKQEMESPTLNGTDEVHEDVSAVVRSNLYEYGLHDARGKKTLKFWTLILAFSITVMLTALDMTMISTALPSIVKDLPMSTIAGGWVTSSYLLTVTAFQPMFGGMSCVIGRRWSLVFAVILFLGGSVICGCANSILLLVVGRGVQGLGGGGIQAIGEITISDITTLRERGFFVGIFGLVFAIASFIAPVLGGYFSDHDWRWIFWINIPIGAIALIMLIPTMNLPVPSMPFKTKIAKMDVVANTVLLGSVVSILIAVTEGGVSHPWSSARIWVPMAVGMVGFFLFLAIEFVPNRLSTHPVLPARLFGNRTACSAFLMTFLHGIATYGAIYALPIYFQSIKDQKPLKSAVSTFPSTAPTAPFAIVAGIIMAITGKYKDLTFIGWAFTAGGFGWMTRFQTGTSEWELVVAQIVAGVGIGILFAITLPPIQASLPIEELETATATYAFCRSFGAIWGIAITTSVLTADVSSKLGSLPQTAELGLTGPTVLGYVENIKELPEPIREQVRQMYADGLQKAMYSFMPIVVVGFACCFWIKDLPLPDFIRGNDDSSTESQGQQQQQHPQQEEQIVTTHQVSFHSSPASSHEPYREKHSLGSPHDDTLVGTSSDHSHRSQPQHEIHRIPSKSSMQQVPSYPDAYASDAYSSVTMPHVRRSSEATVGGDGYGGIVAPEKAHW